MHGKLETDGGSLVWVLLGMPLHAVDRVVECLDGGHEFITVAILIHRKWAEERGESFGGLEIICESIWLLNVEMICFFGTIEEPVHIP